jgi:HisJ family histidinol phosphate phosphatase
MGYSRTMRTDYHMHTRLCGHAIGAPRNYVLAAKRAGLEEIGFSDHNPMPTQFDDWRMAPDQLPTYLGMMEEVRSEFPRYPIRLGLECDFIPGYEGHIQALAGQADWDYLIGSVHYISRDWDVDNPKHLKRWTEQPVDEIWQAYFAAYTKMVESCLFDFLAHPDLVKKFGHRPEGDLSRFYRETLDAAAEARQACAKMCMKFIPAVIFSRRRITGTSPSSSIPTRMRRRKSPTNSTGPTHSCAKSATPRSCASRSGRRLRWRLLNVSSKRDHLKSHLFKEFF